LEPINKNVYDKIKMQIYVHHKCKYSSQLTEWMFENIPEEIQCEFELVYATLQDDIVYVPCIVSDKRKSIGFVQCMQELQDIVASKRKAPSARKELNVEDIPSKYQRPVKSQSVEDKFQDLLSSRKPPSTVTALPVSDRALPSC